MHDTRSIAREPVRGGYPEATFIGLSGVERMRRAVHRRFPAPPISHLIGLRPVEAGIGSCTFSLPASERLQTHSSTFSGGVAALVSDAPLASSITCGLDAGAGVATSQLSLNFLRPSGPWSGKLTARGRLIHTTPTVGLSEVHVADGNGRLIAHGTSRCFLQRFAIPKDSGTLSERPEPPPTYTTPDPYLRPLEGALLPASTWNEMSGLEFGQRLVRGELAPPPVAYLLGLKLAEAAEGTATFLQPAHEWLCSPEGRVYGGATAYLAHDAMAMAVHTTCAKGTTYATLDLTVNFLRPIRADGRDLRAQGRVVYRGRSSAVAAAEIVNADGKVVATAMCSAMILEGRGFSGEHEAGEL